MLKNAYLLAKIAADTAENELNFAEILPNGRRVADRAPAFRRRADLPDPDAERRLGAGDQLITLRAAPNAAVLSLRALQARVFHFIGTWNRGVHWREND